MALINDVNFRVLPLGAFEKILVCTWLRNTWYTLEFSHGRRLLGRVDNNKERRSDFAKLLGNIISD